MRDYALFVHNESLLENLNDFIIYHENHGYDVLDGHDVDDALIDDGV